MIREDGHVTLARGVRQRVLAADRLVDAHRRIDRPRDQGELADGLAAERQALRRDRVVPAAEGEALVRRRRLEDRDLLLEDVAVPDVVGVSAVADVDTEHVRLSLLGATPEAAEQPPAGE